MEMKYQTAIKQVDFFAFHGLYPEEKLTGGRFVVDVLVEQEIDEDASLRRLVEVVNYETLYSIVKKQMEYPRDLIDAVAKCILDDIESRISRVQYIEVHIEKLNPGGLFKSGSAMVSLKKTIS
jgi:dihydroneopterin aldolase